jgi:thiosulfate/3-mercaptopyruvate sulfurtransferase
MSILRASIATLILAVFAGITAMATDNEVALTSSDLMAPAELNRRLPEVKTGKLMLLQVGFHLMYQMGHIPGSQYVGPAAKPEGLAALKKVAAKFPHNQPIVIYCGCCPWNDCPNIRPAFRVLKEMGFANVKVLDLPERLGTDWTAKGYPIVKGD